MEIFCDVFLDNYRPTSIFFIYFGRRNTVVTLIEDKGATRGGAKGAEAPP